MTDQIPMRSASERRDAAKPVLMWLGVYADRAREVITDIEESREADGIEPVIEARDAADDHLSHYVQHIEKQRAVLEALLEVPEVGITEDEIVAESVAVVLDELDVGGDTVPNVASLDSALRSGWFDGDDLESIIRRIARAAVRRAERAALEHWEPADVPSQEFMLRHLGIEHESADHVYNMLRIPEQLIMKEVI
ncbi:hypothetical protein SEA_NIKE_83 [Microbacterium phage Nike]|nr:hypothetical protein SEA_NIKE_83 [Microbacterium phage Nike]